MLNPVVVVTGASRGIGFAVAEAFASEGCRLVISSQDPTKIQTAAEQLVSKYSIEVLAVAADLSTESGCAELAQQILQKYGRVDVLVNNAGVFLGGTMMQEPNNQLVSMMQTNVFSAYYLTKNLWDLFAKNAKSHVFNMCSIASEMAYAAGGSYAVTKHALLGFSRSLRLEGQAINLRVTSVMPGATLTDSWAGVDLPPERFMRSSDVATMIVSAWKVNDFAVVEELQMRPILGDI